MSAQTPPNIRDLFYGGLSTKAVFNRPSLARAILLTAVLLIAGPRAPVCNIGHSFVDFFEFLNCKYSNIRIFIDEYIHSKNIC